MNADGSGQTNLTNSPTPDYSPRWSPSGDKIVFVSQRDGTNDIFVMDADGSNPTNLSNSGSQDRSPTWSSDGSKIAFASSFQIHTMNSDGSNQNNISQNGFYESWPDWSPAGDKIVFVSERSGTMEIYVMDSDGSNATRLTNNLIADTNPRWSSDGTKIAFTSDRDSICCPANDEIYVMDAVDADSDGNGDNVQRLTSNAAGANQDGDPTWSDDGSMIAWVHRSNGYAVGGYDIWAMNANGSGKTNLTKTYGTEGGPDWRP